MAEEAGPSGAVVPPVDLSGLGGGMEPAKGKPPKRAGSAPAKERPPPPPITPRNKKASRSLFRELEGTVATMRHAKTRVERTHMVVRGVLGELRASKASTEKTLGANARMVAGTMDTTPGATKKAPLPKSPNGNFKVRPMTSDELDDLKRELRDEIEANGEERDPTEDEIDAAVKSRLDSKQKMQEGLRKVAGTSNKGIVDALQKLRESCINSITELERQEVVVFRQIGELDKVIMLLTLHKVRRLPRLGCTWQSVHSQQLLGQPQHHAL